MPSIGLLERSETSPAIIPTCPTSSCPVIPQRLGLSSGTAYPSDPEAAPTRHGPRHGISSIYDTHVTLVVELMARIVAPYGIRVSSRLCGCIQIRAAATHPLHPRSISLVTYKCFEQYVSARRILDPEARAAPCPIVRPRVSQDNIHYAPSIVRECFFPPRPSFPPLHTCLLMEPSTRRPVIQTPGGPRLATSL